MAKWEIQIYCNVLVRFIHIDFLELSKGSDTLAIRFLIDGDSDSDNTSSFLLFLDDLLLFPLHFKCEYKAIYFIK